MALKKLQAFRGDDGRRQLPPMLLLSARAGLIVSFLVAAVATAAPLGPKEVYPYDNANAVVYHPAGTGLDPYSIGIADEIRVNNTRFSPLFDISQNSPGVWVASASHPYYSGVCSEQSVRVRFPPGVQPGAGSDAPVVVLNPGGTNDDYPGLSVELRLFQAQISSATRTFAANGCSMHYYSNADTTSTGNDGPPFLGSATGSGVSYLYGMVRPEEVEAGLIPHAIRIAYSNCDFRDKSETGAFRAPATRTDQRKGCSTTSTLYERQMVMGMRVRLDPAVNCDARTLPQNSRVAEDRTKMLRFLRTMCHALQDYGFMPLDGTGNNGFTIYAEGDATANWTSVLGPPDPNLNYRYVWALRDRNTASDGITRSATDGIPWNRWQVMAEGQ